LLFSTEGSRFHSLVEAGHINKDQKMSFERSYYENADLWVIENNNAANQQRIATLAGKVPLDVQTVLDVGCGNGLFLKHLSDVKERSFGRLCGVDRSTVALACMQTEKIRADVDSLPFSKDEFDAVSCMEVLEHLPQATFISALNEISRVARRCIIVSVPYSENLRMSLTECTKCCCRFNQNYHLRTFRQQTMQLLFDDYGFTCRDVFYMYAQRAVPTEIEVIIRLLGVVKRAMLREPRPTMADYAVCPALGIPLAPVEMSL
jgi:ubiquinone/menaquinone biosynthesis C-methylase UbiE